MPERSDAAERHFARLTEACVEGGFRDAHETEVISLWAHGEIIRLREALSESERHRIRPAVNTVRLPPVDHEPEGSGPFGW